MFLLLFLAGALFQLSAGRAKHEGLRWDELVDTMNWDTPQGRTIQVTSISEISSIQGSLQAGDVMVLKAGTYNNPTIRLTASGTSSTGRRIYLVPEVYGGVKLTGKVQIRFDGSYQEVRGMWIDGISSDKVTPVTFEQGSRYCRFTNSAITNFNRLVHDKSHHWIEIWGTYHTIDYNSLEGKVGTGQLVRVKTTNGDVKPPGAVADSHSHMIERNYFGPREDTGEDNGEGIQIGLFESEKVNTKTVMQYNYFYRYDGEIECISVKGKNNTVSRNTFVESACLVTLRHSDNTRVVENWFYCENKMDCGGVRVYGEQHVVINNYIERSNTRGSSRAGIVLYAGDPNDPYKRAARNNLFERNICYRCKYGLYIGQLPSAGSTIMPANNVFSKNLITGSSSSDYCIRERNPQLNPTWDINNIWECRSDASHSGIRVKDPQWVRDSDYRVWKPTAADFIFKMPTPVNRADVGATWRS